MPTRGFRRWQRGTLLLLGACWLVLMVLDQLFPFRFPDADNDFAQVVVDQQGQPLRVFPDQHGVWRHEVRHQDVSPLYISALKTYEDRWFDYHFGVNPVALVRAFWLNWQCDCIVSGGSTLTMQVARRFHPHPRTVFGKLTQMLRAMQLEWHLSKAEILDLYINYAPFGGTLEGVQAASFAYLDKDASQLTHADAAMLAVLPQAPSRMRPDRYPQRAQNARDKVLDRLAEFAVWDNTIIQQAKLERVFANAPKRPMLAPLLARQVRQHHKNSVIHTTIDGHLQRSLEDNLRSWISTQPKHSSAAILVVDNATQTVKAYLGSADFGDKTRFGHVDMVHAIRSPGSTLKPFIYGMAMEQGLIHSHSLLADAPRYNEQYQPKNFSAGFSGPVSVTEALHRSLNLPAVQVLDHLGPRTFYSRMTNAGMSLHLPPYAQPNLSIALGGVGISLWDLVGAYSALANQGQMKTLHVHPASASQSMSGRLLLAPEAAWILHQMLASNPRPDRVHSQSVVKDPRALAWKTGTSYGYRDAWSIGVSRQYTIGVWLGRPDGTPQPGHFGALNAAPLLFRIADVLHQSVTQMQPHIEEKPIQEAICWPIGKPKRLTSSAHCHRTHQAWLYQGIAPPTLSIKPSQANWLGNPVKFRVSQDKQLRIDQHCSHVPYRTQTVAKWPTELEAWIAPKYHFKTQIPKADPRCPNTPVVVQEAIRIVGIEAGQEFRQTRRESVMPEMTLHALGGVGQRDWFMNGRYLFTAAQDETRLYQFQQLGTHQLVVIDAEGNTDRKQVSVLPGL